MPTERLFLGRNWVRGTHRSLRLGLVIADWRSPRRLEVKKMNNLLKETLGLLKELRRDLHSDVSASTLKQIDVVIANIEKVDEMNHSEEQLKQLCLQSLSALLRHVPSIVRIIELISR